MQRARQQAKVRWTIERRQVGFPVEPDPDVEGDEGMPGQWVTYAVPLDRASEWWDAVPRSPSAKPPREGARPPLEPSPTIECSGPVGDPDSVAVVMPFRDGWVLRLEFAPTGDREGMHVVDLRMHLVGEGDRAMSARLIRSMGFASHLARAERALGEFAVRDHFLGSRWSRPVRRPGRAGRGAIEYIDIASRYVEACKAGGDPYEVLLAQEAAAGRYTTRSSLENRIYRARKTHKLIERTEPGRAGGDLTETGRKLLAELQATKEATSGHD